MRVVLVTHPSNRLEQYFGPRALRALQEIAEVRLNPQPRELDTAELIDAAAGCDALIAYRQTAAPRLGRSDLGRLVEQPTLLVACRFEGRELGQFGSAGAPVVLPVPQGLRGAGGADRHENTN